MTKLLHLAHQVNVFREYAYKLNQRKLSIQNSTFSLIRCDTNQVTINDAKTRHIETFSWCRLLMNPLLVVIGEPFPNRESPVDLLCGRGNGNGMAYG